MPNYSIMSIDYYIRPIGPSDLSSVMQVVNSLGDGMTSLPKNPKIISKKLYESQETFQEILAQQNGRYMFGVCSATDHQVFGLTAITANVDSFTPAWRLRGENGERIIRLEKEALPFASEFCSTSLPEDLRSLPVGHPFKGAGKVMSLSRLLYVSNADPLCFGGRIFSEFRGPVIEKTDRAPFGEWIAQECYLGRTFAQVDELYGTIGYEEASKPVFDKFGGRDVRLASLCPEIQRVFGQPHRESAPAAGILEQQGLHGGELFGIHDAGPQAFAAKQSIPLANALQANVQLGGDFSNSSKALVSNVRDDLGFRALKTPFEIVSRNVVRIPHEAARLLDVEEGCAVKIDPAAFQMAA